MNRKTRKSLDDSLATEFVFGTPGEQPKPTASEVKQEVEPLTDLDQPQTSSPRSSLMSKLMEGPTKEPTVRITVDLPQSMHRKLSLLSARSGKKKAEIVRALLEEILIEVDE